MIPRPEHLQSKRAVWALVALLAWFSFVLGAAGAIAMENIELRVKAAFIYNFTKFTVWPDDTFASDDDPLTLCVADGPALTEVLRDSVEGRAVRGRSIRLRSFATEDPPPECRIVFVDASRDPYVAGIVGNLHSRAVLTIGESEAFAASGGMIRLVTEGGKIRFDINARSASEAGIRLRAQLLALARRVEQ